ncbi:P-loop containing nucleoside triphosphate hydrolase protein, partial [Fomitopsis betulina]
EERKHAATTVFGLEWGIVISDEVQGMRTLNKFYTACRMLRKRSDMIVGMSATPGITSPMDFVAIGCFLGVPAFNVIGADDSIVEMRRALASAQRKDTAANKSDKKAAQRLTAMMSGKTGKGASSSVMQSTFVSVVQGYMDDFREKFADIVIRRTVNSLDYEDKPISGLPQYHEQIIALALTDAEHETFKKVVDALAEQAGSGKGFQPIRGGGVCARHHALFTEGERRPTGRGQKGAHFYLAQRRCLTHPSTLGAAYGWHIPTDWADFLKHPTAKLYTLARLLMYHLAGDKHTPLCDGPCQVPEVAGYKPTRPVDDFEFAAWKDGPPDKIIVYSAFPSNNEVVLRVLRAAGVKVETLNGHHSMKQRHKIIERFHRAGRDDARVLLMSSVGTVGLNITCAHIVVFLDTTWSAQDDNQTIGRVWRMGQQRQVIVYRLIAIGSPDVFLNTISFGKAFMHAAFVKSDLEIR